MVSLGCFALEDVFGAAIRANDFAGFQDIEKNARVQAPQFRAGLRAVQRQVVGGDFYGLVIGHFFLPG